MRYATSYGSSIVNDKSGCVLVISCLGLNTTGAILEPTISPPKGRYMSAAAIETRPCHRYLGITGHCCAFSGSMPAFLGGIALLLKAGALAQGLQSSVFHAQIRALSRGGLTTCETAYISPTMTVRGSGGSLQAGEGRDILEQELDRAEVVEPEAIPRDVVTMNSEVRLKDLDSGESRVYRLIFPTQTRTENSVSVLAPIGTAMLGYRVGDVIEWRVPKGIRRLEVLEVIYQPEAAVVSGD